MSSDELKFINTLRENGYEGRLDPAVFKSMPKHLMKWLSVNINSSVLLNPHDLNRLEEIEMENMLMSEGSDIDTSGFSFSRKCSSVLSASLSESDDSDILLNNHFSEESFEDDSDDDDEIKALKMEIKAEDERHLTLKQLNDKLDKTLVEVNETVCTEEKRKEKMTQKAMANIGELSLLYKDLASTFQQLVQRAEQVAPVLSSGGCAENMFPHQVICESMEDNFNKFLMNVEKFMDLQKHQDVVPTSEEEKFILEEVAMNDPIERRKMILTAELSSLLVRTADLHKRQLEAECAAFALPAAEKLLMNIQIGKYNITLEQLKNKTEELKKEITNFKFEVKELTQLSTCTSQQQAQAQILAVFLSCGEELLKNISVKRQAQQRCEACMESYLCMLILLRSILASQFDTVSDITNFISELHLCLSSKHSDALMRMDLMHKLQEEHHNNQTQVVSNNILVKTFQKLLLGEEELCPTNVGSVFDLMSASLDQLKAQNALGVEEHYRNVVGRNVAVVLKNRKEVDTLCGYLVSEESITGFPLIFYDLNDQFAIIRAAFDIFVKKKEQFKSNHNAKSEKISQNSQLRNELLEWVKFINHRKRSIQDELCLDSTSLKQSFFENK